MGEQEPGLENRRFGSYLRRIREGRKLSLDAVEEMSTGYPERITKSHLSRIENGQAIPTFPRLFALSQIYGIPVSSLAEKFEVDLKRQLLPADLEGKSDQQVLDEAKKFVFAGRYSEALVLYSAALERKVAEPESEADRRRRLKLKIGQINALVHLARYESAKQESEQLLSRPELSHEQRLIILQFFVTCCFKMSRYAVAAMGYEQMLKESRQGDTSLRLRAEIAAIGGSLYFNVGDAQRAVAFFEEAASLFATISDSFELCRSRVNLSLAYMETGKTKRAREILHDALKSAEAAGYDRQRAFALSHLGVIEFRAGDLKKAEKYFLRSNMIARSREYVTPVFRNCYYLWKIAQATGDDAGVKANERSLRTYLTRVEESLPEVQAYRAHLAGGES